jgi:CcmD family protein
VNDYIVASFVVVWFVLLMYLAVIAMRTAKMSREVELLSRVLARGATESEIPPAP